MFDIQVPPSDDPTKNNNFLFVKETVFNRLPRECTAHEIESIPYNFPKQFLSISHQKIYSDMYLILIIHVKILQEDKRITVDTQAVGTENMKSKH